LALLDELLKNDRLEMIGCCNELNVGYAADGYCRESGGLGAAVVTYWYECVFYSSANRFAETNSLLSDGCTISVGGLSIVNAVAGAYSEDLPLLVISGGPNTCDSAERRLVHHTIGEHNLYQSSAVFAPVVYRTFVSNHETPTHIVRLTVRISY